MFSANCDGGLTMSLAPERWRANWDDIAAMCQIADRAGMEFILPVAKWRGYQGKANIYGRSFETMTHGAAIGALTRQICVFSTIHVPLVTPAFAAKAIATIDHVTHGRAGLNIVCGWNQEEFDLHGVTIEQDTRYDHGLEWYQVWSRMLEGGPEFDWDGRFFKLRRLETNPVSVQRPRPLVMSAGFSPKGRDFAAQAADALFTTMTELDQAPAMLANVAQHAGKYGRQLPVYAMGHVVCRPTRGEAEEFFHYFAQDLADDGGPSLLPQPPRHDDGTERGAGAASAREPLHARDRQVVLRRLSRHLSVRRHARRRRIRDGAHERRRAGRNVGGVPRLPQGDSLFRAGGAAAAGSARFEASAGRRVAGLQPEPALGDRRKTLADADIVDDLLHALAQGLVLQAELFDEAAVVDQEVSRDRTAAGLRLEADVGIGQELAHQGRQFAHADRGPAGIVGACASACRRAARARTPPPCPRRE